MNDRAYAIVCYHILTDGDHHPSYYIEKLGMLDDGLEAFGRLDTFNQGKVIGHLTKWGIPIPNIWLDYVNRTYYSGDS